jgi:hypothetical protein
MHGCVSKSHTTIRRPLHSKGRGLGYLLMQLIIESAAPKALRLV